MGASREKRERKNFQPPQSTKKEEGSPLIVKILAVFVSALVVCGVAALILYATNTTQRLFTAMTVGDVKVTPAEYNIYYVVTYNDLYQTYQNAGMDTTGEDSMFQPSIPVPTFFRSSKVYILYGPPWPSHTAYSMKFSPGII